MTTVSSRRFNGLFLSLRKRDGETAVQTLVVPPGEYQPGKRLHMSAAQSSQRIAFGRVLEQHPDWVWATVEPLVAAPADGGKRHALAAAADAAGDRSLPGDSRRLPVGGAAGLQHRAGDLRPPRRRARLASGACSGKTNPARRATLHLRAICSNRPTGCPTCLPRVGVGRGDKVAIVLPQRPETAIAHIACYQMGAVAVPLSFLFGPDALEYRLDNAEAKVALVDPASLPNLAAIRARLPRLAHVIGVAGAREAWTEDWESTARARRRIALRRCATRATDPALLIYTSGTTGPPKGALMPQQCLLGNLPGFIYSHDLFPQAGRPVLVARRLGLDRRAHGRAVADALLRLSDRSVSAAASIRSAPSR